MGWADPEIGRLEAELASLSDELATAEADLVRARAVLDAFTRAHDRLLAPLYSELDGIEARIVGMLAAHSGRPDDLREARAARERAARSAAAAAAAADGAAADDMVPQPPSAEAKRRYRALAKRCHPDLGDGEADRARRLAFMARVNDAYAHEDVAALARLASEWAIGDLGAIPGANEAHRLGWLRAAVTAARARLADLRAEIARVKGSGLGPLVFGADGSDAALQTLARRLREQIRDRRSVLAAMQRPAP